MIRDLQHLLFTTVSKVLYSLGHVLAAPPCPPCWGKLCPPCAGGPGRGRAIQAEERSPYEPEDSNYVRRPVGGRSAIYGVTLDDIRDIMKYGRK